EPAGAVRQVGIEFGDKIRRETLIAVRHQHHLSWLLGAVTGDAIGHGEMIAIRGDKYEVRRAREFGGEVACVIEDLKRPFAGVLSQFGRVPDRAVWRWNAWCERDALRRRSSARDLERFDLSFRLGRSESEARGESDEGNDAHGESSSARHDASPGPQCE